MAPRGCNFRPLKFTTIKYGEEIMYIIIKHQRVRLLAGPRLYEVVFIVGILKKVSQSWTNLVETNSSFELYNAHNT